MKVESKRRTNVRKTKPRSQNLISHTAPQVSTLHILVFSMSVRMLVDPRCWGLLLQKSWKAKHSSLNCDTSRFTRFTLAQTSIFDQTPKIFGPLPFFLEKRSPLPPPDHAPPFTAVHSRTTLCPTSTDGLVSPIVGRRWLWSQIRVELKEAAAVQVPPAAHRPTLPSCGAGSSFAR